MSVVINNLIAYKVLSMIIKPFEDTDAYKLGIIDAKGNNLIKPSKFDRAEQKEAYTYLHRLVFNMKKILNKLPGGASKTKDIVAAFWLIKEYYEKNDKQLSLMEDRFSDLLKKDVVLAEEQVIVEKYLSRKDYCDACDRPKSECVCNKESVEEEGGVGGAPTNATGAAVSTDRPAIRSKDVAKYKKKNVSALSFVRRMNKQL